MAPEKHKDTVPSENNVAPPAPNVRTQRATTVTERLSILETVLCGLHTELTSFFHYQISMNNAIAQAFAQLGATVDFPPPPALQQFPARPAPIGGDNDNDDAAMDD